MQEALLSIREVGRYLGYGGQTSGKTTIYNHINHGRLTKVRLGGRSFVTRASADVLIHASVVEVPENFSTTVGEVDVRSDEALPPHSIASHSLIS